MGEMIDIPIGSSQRARQGGVPPDVAGRDAPVGAGAAAQFTAFARAQTASLYRIAYLLTGDEHRAHDLVQTALERTYRAWSRIGTDPFAYARRVIATSRIDAWRRTRREVLRDPTPAATATSTSHAPAGGSDTAPDHAGAVAERDRLVRALQALPDTQRRVVVLRHVLDRSEQQTADELNLARGTVKSAGSRGLTALRAVLSTTHEEDA